MKPNELPINRCWIATNFKTGKEYFMMTDNVICTTNSMDGERQVLYRDDHNVFVRDYDEFYKKFMLKNKDRDTSDIL
jgi:hypothetical protein